MPQLFINLTEEENNTLNMVANEVGLTPERVIVNAFRLYQVRHERFFRPNDFEIPLKQAEIFRDLMAITGNTL